MFFCKFSFGPFETNTILLVCLATKKAAVIDPSYGSTSAILQKAKDLDCCIEKILITHSHWDHIADVNELKQKTSASVYIHPSDAPNLECPGVDRIPLLFPLTGVRFDCSLNQNDEVLVGQLNCQIIHTPGHSPGSICIYLANKEIVFTGDTVFAGSIGNLHLPTSEPERMWDSLDALIKLPGCTRIVPGHGRDTTLMNESWISRAKEIFLDR